MSDGIARHTPILAGQLQSRVVTCDTALFAHVGDTITALVDEGEWLQVEDSIEDVTEAAWLAVESFYGNSMIGKIDTFLRTLPDGWLAVDGSTYDEVDYPELYAVLDDIFKNVPAETFTLPDMSDLFLVGSGSSYAVGDEGGENTHQLTVAEMASHSHLYTMPVAAPDTVGAGAPIPSVMSVTPGTGTSSSGSDTAHENRPPYIAVRFGIFTGR